MKENNTTPKTLRSAIYLAGNKYKLFNKIVPHLDNGDNFRLVDLFGGSGVVSLNCVYRDMFDEVWWNDKAEHLYGLHKWLKDGCSIDVDFLTGLNQSIPKTKDSYIKLVDLYNKSKNIDLLYILHCRSNSNMMRFNKNDEWNMSYGERAPFYPERIKQHQQLLKNITLYNEDFGDMIETLLMEGDLTGTTVYVDSPYLGTIATYNEGGGWTENDNTTLLDYCLTLRESGAKVVVSNVFQNRGNIHQELIDWCENNDDKFVVHHLDMCYNNSSFRKGKGKTDEVLIVSK